LTERIGLNLIFESLQPCLVLGRRKSYRGEYMHTIGNGERERALNEKPEGKRTLAAAAIQIGLNKVCAGIEGG